MDDVDLPFISRRAAERRDTRVDTDLVFQVNMISPYLRYIYDSLGISKSNIEELLQDA